MPAVSPSSAREGRFQRNDVGRDQVEQDRNIWRSHRGDSDHDGHVCLNPGLALLRKWISGGVCYSPARLHRKTVLITGANTGIGKETARDMARRGPPCGGTFPAAAPGARVVMACRDLTRGEKAAEEIRSSTGNSEVVVQQLDLASFASVRQFAKRYSEQEERLDILINNAGVMMCPKGLTVDGFETQFAVNHLGHFLLTNLLLGKLQKSTPSRVITVSSLAHKGGKIHFDDLSFSKTTYNSLTSYRQSKLANLLFARELARRLKGGGPHLGHPPRPQYNYTHPSHDRTVGPSCFPGKRLVRKGGAEGIILSAVCPGSGVMSFALHPGVIRTELGRHVELQNPLLKVLLYIPAFLLLKTPWEGAQTSIYCAVTEGLEGKSGSYFSDCALKKPAPEAQDDLVALRLWEVSAQLVGYTQTD
ncbi:retinol dehydrogenase 13-like [Scleropages formosus]|uniref:Retinol dehydrogenase 13-like n=1 Tax=Scleropages formosus TaxID=113540 RepID=A0A0P7VTF3_SCLFO|nr:retinol dehydrogenase 13-like [Scleropages formosus]